MQVTPVPRSLKEKQRQERETLILQVAEDVLAEKGYHDTSMDEIAMRVGIAKGTIYLHFPSKENLVVAIFEKDMQKVIEAVEAVISSGLTAREKMEGILQFMYSGYFSKRAQLLYSINHSEDLQRLILGQGNCMRELWEHLSARITVLLEEGKAAGEFDSTLPTSVMLTAFVSLLSPRSYKHLIVGAQMPTDELVKHLGHFYFKGIAAA
jgi:AcrR family transcriptional regulator